MVMSRLITKSARYKTTPKVLVRKMNADFKSQLCNFDENFGFVVFHFVKFYFQ